MGRTELHDGPPVNVPMMPLSNDVARCAGVGSDTDGWRDGCEDCLRRTDPGSGQWVTHMSAPSIIMFECEYRIEANRD